MSDPANASMLLFRRLERAASESVLLHELQARVSDDGQHLIVSRYREHRTAQGRPHCREVHRSVPITALLKWMAKQGAVLNSL
ncbi:hypothetical protein C4Q28_11805 [Pseudomonas sp. SWI6]|uniref:Uncharacterized protein n=1 Tax=Pseudomonas taiwanensis TaxID=470150 RepID=A0ABR6V187_9PSED|nr:MULTISPECIES: hypothetical protein [Pseudomonas]AGZ35759.1 hypothetical protein PVLB_14875 [Pseudomonas sp. VLB120]AVD82792.1 hypothetical protein C4Q28_11805 [Pseudomonas sp. SWI6]AVD89748.1 hypothetical protein C4Q26_22510 [Pseudomonas sp. SWI44]MBC3474287.1 hypothetical protein [Pseudomonas taiwanensis]MBC3491802.1 hypothetical protein [Pseudomonas taiwanensis]